MSNWDDYKKTFNDSVDAFTLSRAGDPHQLDEYLNSNVGADINEKNHKGYSPLMISVYNGNYETSELLLQRGADPNSSDLSGNTILMGAAFKGDEKIVRLLLEKGARKETKNNYGFTAQVWASAFGRNEVVAILKTKTNLSRFHNKMNAIKILWEFVKSNFKKEVIA